MQLTPFLPRLQTDSKTLGQDGLEDLLPLDSVLSFLDFSSFISQTQKGSFHNDEEIYYLKLGQVRNCLEGLLTPEHTLLCDF